MLTRMVVGISLLFTILLLMLPRTDEKSAARLASASILMCTKDFRSAIAGRFGEDDLSGVVFENTCPSVIESLLVDAHGEITIRAKSHELIMVLSPRFDGGQVRWGCRGEPAHAVSPLCKE